MLLVLVCAGGLGQALSALNLSVLEELIHSGETFKQYLSVNTFTLAGLLFSKKYFSIHTCRYLWGVFTTPHTGLCSMFKSTYTFENTLQYSYLVY